MSELGGPRSVRARASRRRSIECFADLLDGGHGVGAGGGRIQPARERLGRAAEALVNATSALLTEEDTVAVAVVEPPAGTVADQQRHVDQIGLQDNFFDLGGHSLLVVEAQAKLRQALGFDLPVVKLFQYPTVSSLAA